MALSNRIYTLGLSSMFVLVSACTQSAGSGVATKADQIVRPLGDNVTIMEFKGGKITAKDVEEMVKPQMKRFGDEALEAYQQAARRILVQKLVETEAKAKNTTAQGLMEEMMSQFAATEEEVDQLINSRPDVKEGLKKGFKDPNSGKVQKVTREDIKRMLTQQKAQQNQGKFIETLMAKANAKMLLELPRVKLGGEHAPFIGAANAKVQIQEFSDFQCPYCARAMDMVRQIKETYGDKVKLSFRHMPLSFHEHARPAALATICAQEQGKFWELHDKIFENQKEFSSLKGDVTGGQNILKEWAKSVGVDVAKFEKCMSDSKTAATLQKDMDEAGKVGVNGTPAFFVNGKKVQAGSFEEFKSVIDEEMTRL